MKSYTFCCSTGDGVLSDYYEEVPDDKPSSKLPGSNM